MINNPTEADLRAALAGGGTATFACNGTIALSNSITISEDTILDGAGYTVTISGGNALRIFQVAPGVNFWIKSLTLSNGRVVGANGADGAPPSPGQDAFAGAILSQGGTLTLTSCTLSNNGAQAGNGGNPSSGQVVGAIGGAAFGGAIYVSGGNLNMTNCMVTGSTLTSGMGTFGGTLAQQIQAGDAGDAAGGAIYLLNVNAVLQSVTVANAMVTGGAGSTGYYPPPNGGGTVSRGGVAAGGAIYATNSTILILNSTLSGNSANGGGAIGGYPTGGGSGSGAALGACLFVSAASSATIRLSTLSGNVGTGGNGYHYDPAGAGLGGGIYNLGHLEASDMRFSGNQCLGGSCDGLPSGGRGGGIYSQGTLIINRCTLDGNSAKGGSGGALSYVAPGEGGGIWASSLLSATNCTFATNLALGGAGDVNRYATGGPGRGGAIMTAGGGILVNLTIAGNRADSQFIPYTTLPGPAQGGGLAATNTPPTLTGTIIANSTLGSNVWGVATDAGYNISSDGSAGFTAAGSLNNTDPLLASLTNNGGPTLTMALYLGSPALDRIPSGFPPTDQRGVSRPQGPAAEVGAYEGPGLNSALPPPPTLSILVSRDALGAPQITVAFNAQGQVVYRLLSSANLVAWTSVATNSTPNNGPLTFTQPISTGSAYYRVVTP